MQGTMHPLVRKFIGLTHYDRSLTPVFHKWISGKYPNGVRVTLDGKAYDFPNITYIPKTEVEEL